MGTFMVPPIGMTAFEDKLEPPSFQEHAWQRHHANLSLHKPHEAPTKYAPRFKITTP